MQTPYIYKALNVKRDYAQKRADDNYNLLLQEKLGKQSDEDFASNQAALEKIGEYVKSSGDMMKDFLPQDAQRVSQKELSLRNEVYDALKQSNVDPSHFLISGGKGKLDMYSAKLSNSPEIRTGKNNMKNFVLGTTDLGSGKIARDVPVEVNGQQKLVPWTDAVQMHKDGKIKELPYNGAIPPFQVDPLAFARVPNPEGTSDNRVTANTFEKYLELEGRYSPEDAKVLMKKQNYLDPKDPSKTVFFWGNSAQDDYRKSKEYADQQFAYKQQQTAAKKLTTLVDAGNEIMQDEGFETTNEKSADGTKIYTKPNQYTTKEFPDKKFRKYNQYHNLKIYVGSTTGKTGASIPVYKTIDAVYKDQDGNLFYDLKENRYANKKEVMGKLYPMDNIYSGVLQPHMMAVGGQNADAHIQKMQEHANQVDPNSNIGFPLGDEYSAPQQLSSSSSSSGSSQSSSTTTPTSIGGVPVDPNTAPLMLNGKMIYPTTKGWYYADGTLAQ